MEELQYLMYAENKHSLLIVLQGLDAAGKDGVVRHVLSGMNPSGLQSQLTLSNRRRERTGARFSLARAPACAGQRLGRNLQSLAL